MEVVLENRVVPHINGHGPGQTAKSLPPPVLAIAEGFTGQRVPPEQIAAADESIPAMINSDFIGFERQP